MRLYLIVLALSAWSTAVTAQTNTGQYIVHRHLKVVGTERYSITRAPSGEETYSIDCNYKDRGTDIPLKAEITLSPTADPVQFNIKGKTSRFSAVDDSMVFSKDSTTASRNGTTSRYATVANSFPVDGYAPATIQWLLVKYWLQKGKPSSIQGFPEEVITITETGVDTLSVAGVPMVVNGYAIKDVIWGWEFLWTDTQGKFVALTTINGEGDKIEFVDEKYEELLTPLTQLSARYGVAKYAFKNVVSPDLAITNCVYTDMNSGKELPGYTILMKNGTIVWSGADAKARIPSGAKIIEGKGRHALPGLWDMHAHLKQVEWGPAYIAAGVTTVRDMANEFDFINTLKSSIDEGKGVGPTIYRAGLTDGIGPNTNGVRIADTPEQAIALVKEYKQNGFEQIKLYGSLKPEIVSAICDEAHRQGLTVTGHIPTSVPLMEAIEKGLDQIDHLQFIVRAMDYDKVNNTIDLNNEVNRGIISVLKKRKIVVDPTMAVTEMIFRPLSSSMTDIEPAFDRLPKLLQLQFINMGTTDAEAARRKAMFELQKKVLLHLYKSGIPIVAGTDMLIPGYTLYRELELYVSAGFTPLQALQCATVTPAKLMAKQGATGTLVNGSKADIILVDGNPLKNISDIRKIDVVIRNGEVFDPQIIGATVGFGKETTAH